MVLSEFDQYCTLVIHRSHHHYCQTSTSVASSIAAVATGASETFSSGGSVSTADSSGGPYLPQQPQISDLQKRLENSKSSVKLQALKEVILWVVSPGSTADVAAVGGGASGSSTGAHVASRLLMTIIRFVLPSTDHKVTKMLQLFWEMVDKTKPDGSLKEEMILVCNKLREDLLHSNEYIRGSTLRLLCKVKFVKILEPLVEVILQNLTHHHAYVRRNAIMCIYSMIKSLGVEILPQASEEIHKLLLTESDLSTKRNAFLMLIHCDLERAIQYSLSVQDSIGCLGDVFQLALLELLRRVSRENPSQTSNLLRIIETLVDSCSPAVGYEGASALVSLSSSPVALKAATRAYIGLLTWQADNTVKLIVLDRLKDVLEKHSAALEEFAIDILRSLSCPSLAVRKKALHISLQLVSSRIVADVTATLRKELIKTLALENQQDVDSTQHAAYQRLLIQSMRVACRDHLDIAAGPVLPILLDFLSNKRLAIAAEASMFVRELVAMHKGIRMALLPKLIDTVADIPNSRVTRSCLWMIGEYSDELEVKQQALNTLYEALLPLPLPQGLAEKGSVAVTDTADEHSNGPAVSAGRKVKVSTRTVVLSDGTYGTEDVYEDDDAADNNRNGLNKGDVKPSSKLRVLILNGDFLFACSLALACTKLVAKCPKSSSSKNNTSVSPTRLVLPQNHRAKALLIVSSLLKFCRDHPNCGRSADCTIRIHQALKILILFEKRKITNVDAWFPDTLTALTEVLENEKEAALYEADGLASIAAAGGHGERRDERPTEPHEAIIFDQIGGAQNRTLPQADKTQADESAVAAGDLNFAVGLKSQKEDTTIFQRRLANVQQMTGLADPVYVEAFLQFNQFDLVVEFLIINRTNETLQNVNVEFCTHGDIKVVERPPPVTLLANQARTLHASIKVHSTETGIIFGQITFDKTSSIDKEYLVLNELHVDLLGFIQRRWISELSFRSMWAEFEWENKISINTSHTDVAEFLQRIMQQTNMTIVGKYYTDQQEYKNQFSSLSSSVGAAGAAAGAVVPFETDNKIKKKSHITTISSSSNSRNLRMRPWNESSSEYKFSAGQATDAENEEAKNRTAKQIAALKRLMDNSSFFAVNLYSKSIFDEDALANVSIEKTTDHKLSGTVRIRSRSQGIALSLGDRITVVQRSLQR